MAKAKAAKKKPQRKGEMDMDSIRQVELVPDAWPRFERLVKSAGEMGHKPHREKTKTRA